jgi:hypothetical protein
MDLRWTPHVPGLAANPTTCAAAGRHRCSRACEVHARYEAGTSPEAMSAARQLEPGHAEQLQQDGGIPARVPRAPSNPADERSGQPRPLCPPGIVSRSPGRLPQSSAHRPPGRPRSGKHGGRRADTRGCTPDSAARVKPEHAADAARPWPSVENRRLHRPSWRPDAVRYTSVRTGIQAADRTDIHGHRPQNRLTCANRQPEPLCPKRIQPGRTRAGAKQTNHSPAAAITSYPRYLGQ